MRCKYAHARNLLSTTDLHKFSRVWFEQTVYTNSTQRPQWTIRAYLQHSRANYMPLSEKAQTLQVVRMPLHCFNLRYWKTAASTHPLPCVSIMRFPDAWSLLTAAFASAAVAVSWDGKPSICLMRAERTSIIVSV